MVAYIYSGEGVSRHSLEALVQELSLLLPFSVEVVGNRFFVSQDWERSASLIVFPGGRDLPYQKDLKGEAIRRISAFVQEGGAYLGICAGGYFGASEIEFERGGPLEVCGTRELAFFQGKAIGPAYGPGRFAYDSERGACVAPISWEGGVVGIYYNGGCYFETPEAHPTVEVIARYHELPRSPAAAVLCQVGEGKALLTGIHPEYSTEACELTRRSFLKSLLIKNLH